MAEPPDKLGTEFAGWDDPPWRAHTSASILYPDNKGAVESHILVDVGAGVGDSLVCSKLKGLENIHGILISHWHPDHVLGLNQVCESVRRTLKSKGKAFVKLPVYCTQATYHWMREKGGLKFELDGRLCFREIIPEVPFDVLATPRVRVTALPVAHGGIRGAVIFVAQVGEKKAVFGWDVDLPDVELSKWSKTETNLEVFKKAGVLRNADVLFMEANTYRVPKKSTGHNAYEKVGEYLSAMGATDARVYLVHLSGHEDEKNNPGWGWTDSEWETAVGPHRVARQGQLIAL